jgi:hypothetical protein
MNPESEADDQKALCLQCLHPNDPEAHFCEKCGAPCDSYAATAPFEQIFAQGHAFRNATNGRPRPIVVIGIWLICLPGVINALVFSSLLFSHSEGRVSALIFLLYGALSAALIVLSTRRYLLTRGGKDAEPEPEGDARGGSPG